MIFYEVLQDEAYVSSLIQMKNLDTLYRQVEQTIRQQEVVLNVGNNVKEEKVRHAIRWVMRDNPDIFWYLLDELIL